MPLYEIECVACGKRDEEFSSVVDAFAHIWPACRECGGKMRRVYTVPTIHGNDVPGFSPYWSENLSKDDEPVYVKSRDHRKQLMKDLGVARHEPGMEDDRRRERNAQKEARRQEISRAVDSDEQLDYMIQKVNQ